MAHMLKEVVGATGRRYVLKELLQHHPPSGPVWVATYEHEKFVLKDIPKNIFSSFNEAVWPQLRQNPSPLLRLPIDTIPGQRTFVYRYMKKSFLQLVRERIPMPARQQILKATLEAIACLHDRDVVHLGDIKPDNIMVDCAPSEKLDDQSQIALIDLENAAHIPRGTCIKGMLAGNDNWRSPEAHFKGELSKPSDMFSFGLVCIFARLEQIICGPDEDFEKHVSQGALPAMIRLQRLVSYFGDVEGLNGLMKHVSDEEVNCQVLSLL